MQLPGSSGATIILEDALSLLATPAVLIRTFFLASASLILIIQFIPPLRSRFLAYGSRATPATHNATTPAPAVKPSQIERLLDWAASLTVRHNYFTHFYITSVACSLFWAWYLRIQDAPPARQIPFGLMLLQGVRRMYESWAYTSSSTSRMWFAHYILGLAFYITINIAIWVDGPVPDDESALWKIVLLSPGMAFAYTAQHSYHAYLYELRVRNQGYQLPNHWLFRNLLCPHYTCDVVIYALLSFLAAPEGHFVSWSLVCGTIFTAVNLGVTAVGTKEWYMAKFGAERVEHRKRMIPGVW